MDLCANPAVSPLAERGIGSLLRFKVKKDGKGISLSDLMHQLGSKSKNTFPCIRLLRLEPLVNDVFFRIHRQSVQKHLVMNMGTGCPAGVADKCDLFAASDFFAGLLQ